jgi:hypothetical protein
MFLVVVLALEYTASAQVGYFAGMGENPRMFEWTRMFV